MRLDFRKGNARLRNILFVGLALLGLMFVMKDLLFFLALCTIVALMTYFNYSFRLPFDLSPVLVMSLVVSREYGMLYSIAFIIVSGIIPMIFAGGSFDHTTLFYTAVLVLVNIINSMLPALPHIPLFIGLSLLNHIVGSIGSVSFFGANLAKEALNLALQMLVDLFYIFTFSAFALALLA
jgi:hypothetical protein